MNPLNVDVIGLRSTLEGAARLCALLLAALCLPAVAAAQTTDFVELVSANAAGTGAGNARSTLPQVSADGRFVVFSSEAGDLGDGDANGVLDVYVRDLQTDTTRLVSVNASGSGAGNGVSSAGAITPDGRFVMFDSAASDLVAGDANGKSDVFVRDLQLNTTTLVSVNGAGTGSANADSRAGFLTPDGRYAVFMSAAGDLIPGDFNSFLNVFRRDLQTNSTVLVSVNSAGTGGGNGNSIAQAVTPDGRFVVFRSTAANLSAADTSSFFPDLFRRDLQTGTTAIVSIDSAGTDTPAGSNENAVISDDGRFVVFESSATRLVPGAVTGAGFPYPLIYERDFVANTTSLVSEPQVFQGVMATIPPATSPRVSADGRYVFYLRAENFVGGLNRPGFRDRIFRRDRQTGELLELPFVTTGICEQGFNCRSIIDSYVTSPDGRYVAYRQREQPSLDPMPYSTAIVIRDMVGGGTEVVTGLPGLPFNLSGEVPLILTPGNVTAGGKLAFSSGVAHAAADTNAAEDVYLFAPPAQNRLAFTRSGYSITENGVVGFQGDVRVRRTGYLIDSTVTVRFATSDGTADAGSDYAAGAGTLTFAPGETEKTLAVQVFNEEVIEPTPETLSLTLSDPTGNALLGAQSTATLTINDDDPHFFQYQLEAYDVSESDFSVLVTITATGTPTAPISIGYATSDGTAGERSDYVTARGRLHFAPGETAKSFRLLVTDDAFVEGVETVNLSLFDPRGTNAAMGTTRATSVVRITSDDAAAPASNPVDSSAFFVRQHYHDFLNRPPDASGFQFWTNEIELCGADAACREVKRINVSAAYFLSIEFQQTGYLAYLTHKTAFGTRPLFEHFMYDVQTLQRGFVFGQTGSEPLDANKRAYFDEFVGRTAFIAKYAGKSNAEYVNTLLSENGLAPTVGNVFVRRLAHGPGQATAASGLVVLSRDVTGAGLDATLSLSFQNLTGPPTAVHIHGPAGQNAPPLVILPGDQLADHRIRLTDQIVSLLNAGQLSIDVHTESFPEGELRAQLGPALFRADVLASALDEQLLTRAQVLRVVAQFDETRVAEFSRAFVLMQYFGYLRRDPDEDGYNFWLSKLEQFGGDYVRAEMVKAFISSAEYRGRFGP